MAPPKDAGKVSKPPSGTRTKRLVGARPTAQGAKKLANLASPSSRHVPPAHSRVLGRSQRIKRSFKNNQPPGKSSPTPLSKHAVLPTIKTFMERYDEMLTGCYDKLPPKPPSEVRIFLSSTFSDMRKERNGLVKHVYPKIKQFCYEELDLPFQMVDMRWGVTDDATNDHMTEKLCLAEIKNCQRLSLGPNFVTILGDRYGSRQIPTEISPTEFDIILKEAEGNNLPNTILLKEWYLLDENASPPLYILQPIRSKLPHFGDNSPANEANRKRDNAAWWDIHAQMQDIFKTSAESANKKGHLTDSQKHAYFKSVTEFEIEEGILNASDPAEHTLCFLRKFTTTDLDCLRESGAKRHFDTVEKNGTVMTDPEVTELRNILWQKKISSKLPSTHITKYELPWKPDGIDPSFDAHGEYLSTFLSNFQIKVLHMVTSAQDNRGDPIIESEYYTTLDETLHHLHFCEDKCAVFRGQKDAMVKVKQYLREKKNRSPLVIHAESGLGKTSLMAMVFKQLTSWFGGNVVRVIRFLGTSPESTTIYKVLFSVMGQLADVYDLILEPVGYSNMKSLIKYLPRFLRNISRAAKEPIFILLDSVDQLESKDDPYSMTWLLSDLPSNINIIISTLPRAHNILDNSHKVLPEGCFIELQPLGDDTREEIRSSVLTQHSRRLTEEQNQLIISSNATARSPLLLKLLLDRALTWKSYQSVETITVADTVRGAINQLFNDLENKYGLTLISYTLGYLTVGMNGLTETELEGALSCNDTVLNEVYQYHDPPVEGVVSIPNLLWARVRHDIREYIVERLSFGKKTIFWYHRQFIEAARERYASGITAKDLHRDLVLIYLAEDGICRDIVLKKRKLTIKGADRLVTPQPLVPRNKRKLLALPYHLIFYGDLDQLKQQVLCNLKFMMTKFRGISGKALISDYNQVTQDNANVDCEISLLEQCLTSLKHLKQPDNLPVEFLLRLPDDPETPYIGSLLKQCREYLEMEKKPTLIPMYACLLSPETPVLHTTEMRGSSKVLSRNSSHVLLQIADETGRYTQLQVFDLKTKRVHSISYHTYQLVTACIDAAQEILVVVLCGTAQADAESKLLIEQRKVTELGNCIHCHSLNASSLGQSETGVRVSSIAAHSASQGAMNIALALANNFVVLWDSKSRHISNNDIWTLSGRQGKVDQLTWANDGTLICVFSGPNEEYKKVYSYDHMKMSTNCVEIKGCTIDIGRLFEFDEEGENKGVMFYATQVQSSVNAAVKVAVVNCKRHTMKEYNLEENVKAWAFGKVTKGQGKFAPVIFLASHCQLTGFNMTSHAEIVKKDYAFGEIQSIAVDLEDGVVLAGGNVKYLQMWQIKGDKCGEITLCANPVQEMLLNHSTDVLVTLNFSTKVEFLCMDILEKCLKAFQESFVMKERDGDTFLKDCSDASNVFFTRDSNYIIVLEQTGCISVWDVVTRKMLKKFNLGNVDSISQNKNTVFTVDQLNGCVKVLMYASGEFVVNDIVFPEFSKPVALTVNQAGDTVYIITKFDVKLSLTTVNVNDNFNITSCCPIKQPFPKLTQDFKVMLTENEEFLVIKSRVTEMELKIIKRDQPKDEQVFADYKFDAISLKKDTDIIVPCYLILTKIPCVGSCFMASIENNVLIGRNRTIVVWDPVSGKCDQKMVKGTKTPGYFRPIWIEDDKSWNKHCFGKTTCMSCDEKRRVLLVGSEDGFVMAYEMEQGKNITGKLKSTKPPHSSKVVHVAVSEDGLWGASASEDSCLIVWKLHGGVTSVFSMKTDLKVNHLRFSFDSSLLAVTGTREFGNNKTLLFKVVTGSLK